MSTFNVVFDGCFYYESGDDGDESYWGTDGDESCEDEDSHCGEGQIAKPSDADSEEVSDLEKLKGLRKKFNLKIKSERLEFLRQFKTLIRKWKDEFPNLRDIFRPREIDRLLSDTTSNHDHQLVEDPFIDFVIDTGYKDEPKLDEDGKPLLRRTTALHYAATNQAKDIIEDLFEIYNRYDVNYADKYGFTHFHLACKYDCEDAVENFLELGQDPNLLVSKTRDSPLHWAVTSGSDDIVRMLLRRGADPNLANENRSTPLHIICEEHCDGDVVDAFFEVCDEQNQLVQLDAQDKWGNTPLHLALTAHSCNRWVAELLLRRGASPNLVNEKGSTPLHIICKEYRWDYAIDMFFKVCDEKNHVVQVDARDKSGRTPLQLAVASLTPSTIDALLDRGANLSSFVFPNESHFTKIRGNFCFKVLKDFKLTLTAGTLAVIECLEKKGYKLDRSDALTIMKLIVEHECLDESLDLEKFRYNDDEFMSIVKEMMINPSLSVYDFIQLQPKEAAKRLKYTDFYELVRLKKWERFVHSRKYDKANCAVYLCQKLSRRFFRRWALDSFLELTRHRLPIFFCKIIVDKLMNKDLYHTFLATVD